ncbi:MAG: RNA polymerase sigma factor [Anaerolineales bacterium]|nr:RNA polymerase sigma factor [Anaerolineales bacterium]
MSSSFSDHPDQAPPVDRTNEEWIADLSGPDPDPALKDLRNILVNGLRAALSTYQNRNLENILEDFVQEALLKILDNLHSFRGESRFTTWAQKISINVAFTELRRRRWQNVSLQDMIDRYDSNDFTPVILTDPSFSPEQQTLLSNALELIDQVINLELTAKQRDALVAVILGGVPLEEVASRMGTNRNALYKLIHDARKRLKQRLTAAGLSPDDILAIFED